MPHMRMRAVNDERSILFLKETNTPRNNKRVIRLLCLNVENVSSVSGVIIVWSINTTRQKPQI